MIQISSKKFGGEITPEMDGTHARLKPSIHQTSPKSFGTSPFLAETFGKNLAYRMYSRFDWRYFRGKFWSVLALGRSRRM
jgi:hypothetical protein